MRKIATNNIATIINHINNTEVNIFYIRPMQLNGQTDKIDLLNNPDLCKIIVLQMQRSDTLAFFYELRKKYHIKIAYSLINILTTSLISYR